MTATATLFVDDVAQTALEARVPSYVADTGMTMGASNAPGIGISDDNPGLAESLPNWTLLDQFGNARNAQISQCIGGDGITLAADWPGSGGNEGTAPDAVVRFGANPANVDGQPNNDAPIVTGAGCDLVDLAVGWEDVV